MNISARRVLLQKALRGGLALAGLTASNNGIALGGGFPPPRGLYPSTGLAQASEMPAPDPDFDERNKLDNLLNKQLRSHYERGEMFRDAINNMDMDLQILRSTSPTWRAGQMYDRLKARRAVADKIREKIRRIWAEPLAKIKDEVISWFIPE